MVMNGRLEIDLLYILVYNKVRMVRNRLAKINNSIWFVVTYQFPISVI